MKKSEVKQVYTIEPGPTLYAPLRPRLTGRVKLDVLETTELFLSNFESIL